MSEILIQIASSLKLLAVVGFATLYGFGGISGKWKRRVLGSLLYTLSVLGFSLWLGSFSFWYLLIFPVLFGALSIGYGADTIGDKLIKRSRYGLICALASLPVFIVQGAWSLLALHIVIVVGTSVVAGVWNQTSSARAEETLIGASIVLVPLMVI